MKYFTLIPITLVSFVYSNLPLVEAYWKPKPGLKWNWALGTKISNIPIENTSYNVIDVDLYAATNSFIEKMHKGNKKVICYFSAGTYEVERKEAQGMLQVENLVRNKMDEWNEYWLDFRVEGIKPFMTERLDMAKAKGCDGIEFDNVDAFNSVDWEDAITPSDQLKYDKWLANEAHIRDMAAGFKNSIEFLEDLKDVFDFAINEECNEYNECGDYSVFLNKNLAVFVALYGYTTDKTFMKSICNQVKGLNLSIIIKDPNESLQYDYTEFDYDKYCSSGSTKSKTSNTTTTTKKTTTTTVKTTTTTKKPTTTVKTTTTTIKQITTTVKKATTITVKPTFTTIKTTSITKKPTTTTVKTTTTSKKTTTTTKKTTTTTKKPTTTTTTTKKPNTTATVKKTTTTTKKTTTTTKKPNTTTTVKKTTTSKKTAKKTTIIIKTIIKTTKKTATKKN